MGVNHRISFVLTLVTTGILNFYTVSAAFDDKTKTKPEASD